MNRINEAEKLRLTQRRPMNNFLVSLLPRYFDEGERAFIANIRERGCTANANAHGSGWYEGHGQFAEREWTDKRWRVMDTPKQLARQRAMAELVRAQRELHREQMKAARADVEAEWQREKEKEKNLKAYAAVQAKERRERWHRENNWWLNAERRAEAVREAEAVAAADERQQQQLKRDQQAAERIRAAAAAEHAEKTKKTKKTKDDVTQWHLHSWHQAIFYRRDMGHYTWDTLKSACRIAIVDHRQEFMSQIMVFLNLHDDYYLGVLNACTELVNEGKLVRLR
jgi:hypothetical protein